MVLVMEVRTLQYLVEEWKQQCHLVLVVVLVQLVLVEVVLVVVPVLY